MCVFQVGCQAMFMQARSHFTYRVNILSSNSYSYEHGNGLLCIQAFLIPHWQLTWNTQYCNINRWMQPDECSPLWGDIMVTCMGYTAIPFTNLSLLPTHPFTNWSLYQLIPLPTHPFTNSYLYQLIPLPTGIGRSICDIHTIISCNRLHAVRGCVSGFSSELFYMWYPHCSIMW